jgi:asparagine synthase (glutamine-hydrolysing)
MCGIAGFVGSKEGTATAGTLELMTNSIRHRGPDDWGSYHQGNVFLGHRRLSIVDLALGHQPLANEDRSLWIVFNGEIFNHAALRPELEARGHRYQTHSDTETILHAFEEYGPACLERFRGMFSFVLWDEKKQSLFAARDRLGIKPFYYYFDGKNFAFASEIKALFEFPGVKREIEPSALPEYLAFGYLSSEKTFFRGIRKLMPGHHLRLEMKPEGLDLQIEPYWDVPAPGGIEVPSNEAGWVARIREGLEETVRLRLMADVPLGTFLSGGVDSSAITALVARQTGTKVKTFSVGYAETSYSELPYAAQVAAQLGTDHHEVLLGREEFFELLPGLIWHEDEPISWPSSVSLYQVSRLAGQHVKVVLTGEGADELFGGYERYRWQLLNTEANRFYGLLPAGLRRGVRNLLATTPLLRAGLRRKLKHTFLGRDNTLQSLYLDNFYGAFTPAEQAALLKGGETDIYSSFEKYWQARGGGGLDRMLYADQKTYLVELLMKQDQMSMATSIESRVPFLDHHFVQLAMNVPDGLKIRGGEQKYILKKAVEDLLPPEIVYRKKMGFPTPLRQWFREAATAKLLDQLTAPDSFVLEYLEEAPLRELVSRHRAGLEDATDRLWRLVNLEIWGRIQFRGQPQDAAGLSLAETMRRQ